MNRWLAALGAAGSMLAAPLALAQDFPNKPIRLVVPFPPGGTTDTMARIVAHQIEIQMGQSVIVENRGGANGMIGFEQVARAAPDGYTLMHTSPSIVINEFIYKEVRYKVGRDYVPITNLATGTGYLILVAANSPYKTLAELAVAAKARKDGFNYGSAGIGNTTHLVAELVNTRLGIEPLHVPYKGLADAMNAVIAGDVQMTVTPPTVAVTFVRSGRLRALAFTGASRWDQLPNVPTVAEAGWPAFDVNGGWFGWFAPRGTPPAIAARIQAEVAKALQVPEVRDFILKGGYHPDGRSTEDFRKFLDVETARYGEAVKAAKIQPQ